MRILENGQTAPKQLVRAEGLLLEGTLFRGSCRRWNKKRSLNQFLWDTCSQSSIFFLHPLSPSILNIIANSSSPTRIELMESHCIYHCPNAFCMWAVSKHILQDLQFMQKHFLVLFASRLLVQQRNHNGEHTGAEGIQWELPLHLLDVLAESKQHFTGTFVLTN